MKQTEVKKPVNQKDFQANTTHKNNNKSNISLVGMRRNEVYPKTDDNEKKQKIGESKAGMSIIEDTIAKEEYQSDKQIYKDVEHMKIFETNIPPTPSPRIKKRLRREQFLLEHKHLGKEVLALAKTWTTQDMLICNDNLVPQVILIQNK